MKGLILAICLLGQTPEGTLVVKDADFTPPDVKIKGPAGEVKPGRNIRLSVDPPASQPGLYSATYTWSTVPPAEDLEVDRLDGTRATFGSGGVDPSDPSQYTVTVYATFTFVNWETKKIATKSKIDQIVVKIKKLTPDPPPNPLPVKPTLPTGQFGIAQIAYDTLNVLSTADKTTVAAALAKNYRQIASEISKCVASNQPVISQQLITEVANLNASVLIGKDDSYGPALDNIAAAATAQKALLKTTADWIALFSEIATGLEAVK